MTFKVLSPVLLRQLDSLQMEVIGRTNEGREIRVVKINSNNTQVQHVKAMFDCSVAQNSEKIVELSCFHISSCR